MVHLSSDIATVAIRATRCSAGLYKTEHFIYAVFILTWELISWPVNANSFPPPQIEPEHSSAPLMSPPAHFRAKDWLFCLRLEENTMNRLIRQYRNGDVVMSLSIRQWTVSDGGNTPRQGNNLVDTRHGEGRGRYYNHYSIIISWQ